MKQQFKNKVIIITGSTQGSGAETARLFASRGAKAITICGRQEDKAMEVKILLEKVLKFYKSNSEIVDHIHVEQISSSKYKQTLNFDKNKDNKVIKFK